MNTTTGISLFTALILTFAPVAADPPQVMTVEPTQGYVDEDTQVTLTGEGFDLGARVGLIRLQNERLVQRINLHLALGGSFDENPAVGAE